MSHQSKCERGGGIIDIKPESAYVEHNSRASSVQGTPNKSFSKNLKSEQVAECINSISLSLVVFGVGCMACWLVGDIIGDVSWLNPEVLEMLGIVGAAATVTDIASNYSISSLL